MNTCRELPRTTRRGFVVLTAVGIAGCTGGGDSGSSSGDSESGAAGAPAGSTPTPSDTATPTPTETYEDSGSDTGEFRFEPQSEYAGGSFPFVVPSSDAQGIFDDLIGVDGDEFYMKDPSQEIGDSTFDEYGLTRLPVSSEDALAVVMEYGEDEFYGIGIMGEAFFENNLRYNVQGARKDSSSEYGFEPFGTKDQVTAPKSDKYLVDTGVEATYGVAFDMTDFMMLLPREDIYLVNFNIISDIAGGTAESGYVE